MTPDKTDIREQILPVPIEDEMKDSYLDYAMSVIVSRALPDVADGLKPVHKRILFSMYQQNLTPDRPFKKSAATVGDVMAKYHPHGDSSIYDAMVRMAQDFSMRYPLVEGHGNFGSVDGDPPAAMRYTEARLGKIAMEMLQDIDMDTVDFRPNYDNSLKEPVLLPSRIPNLLVNGSSGIAVGMATNIPPHNMNEIIDALCYIIDNPDYDEEKVIRMVKAPDFPTGGLIMGTEGAKKAYKTGRGSVIMRARTALEERRGGRFDIIVTEIPYLVNKAKLIEDIAELVKLKKLSGIRDIRDESDRRGMRIVIELSSNATPQITLNQLFKRTSLQSSFGINMLALVDGIPRTLSLPSALTHYLHHRYHVVRRRSEFLLKKAKARAHILEGLQIALDQIDQVIKTIRSSESTAVARQRLMEQFYLSELQAQAILDMRLQRLTGLERQKIEEEYAQIIKNIAYLEDLLSDGHKIYQVVKHELIEVKEKFGDARRSEIVRNVDISFDVEDLIPEAEVFLTVTHGGYVKRSLLSTYKKQKKGGKGVGISKLKEEDFIEHTFIATTHHYLLFFSNKAKVYRVKVHEIPETSKNAMGTHILNFVQIDRDEKITAIIPVRDFNDESGFLTMATRQGYVKKTPLSDYANITKSGKIATKLEDFDELISVHQTSGDTELMLLTRKGRALRFNENQIRSMGRGARGVGGIRFRPGDELVTMDYICKGTQVLIITENGLGKRTPVSHFPSHNRRGYGVIAIKTSPKTGNIVNARVILPNDEVIVTTNQGKVIRLNAKDISLRSRQAGGVIVIRMEEGDSVTGFSVIPSDSLEDTVKNGKGECLKEDGKPPEEAEEPLEDEVVEEDDSEDGLSPEEDEIDDAEDYEQEELFPDENGDNNHQEDEEEE